MPKSKKTIIKTDHTPNEKRGIVKNPNNIAHEKDRINRLKQLRENK